jgi:hypothetical protein
VPRTGQTCGFGGSCRERDVSGLGGEADEV